MVPDSRLGRDALLTALTWERFGDPDRAIAAIRRALAEEPDQQHLWLWHPVFDPLRERPEFQEFLARAGLDGRTVERTP